MERFDRSIETVRRWAEAAEEGEGIPSRLREEMLIALEELRVAQEELKQQNEELADTHTTLAHERERYRELFEFAPEPYVITSPAGLITEINVAASRLLGIPRRYLLGKALASFVSLEQRPRFRAALHDAHAGGSTRDLEVRLTPRGLPPLDVALAVRAAQKNHGPVTGLRWLIRDVTEERQAQQEIRELNAELERRVAERTAALKASRDEAQVALAREQAARLAAESSEAHSRHVQKLESIGVLAGGIAHDFNNLLHVVLGNADLARLNLAEHSPAREHLDEVVRATQRAAELTQQLLAYSGKGTVEVRQLDLSHEVREMGTLLRTAITRQAVLHWDLAPDLPAISADPTQIRQIVMNLITNASDAIGDASGVITLRTGVASGDEAEEGAGEQVFLEVSDTGTGMSPDTVERIFDPFFSTKFTGRGLGLSAVMGIVESHRGDIRIRTAPSEGTTFRVLFPSVVEAAPPIDSEPPWPTWQGNGIVLVVEDEEGVRDVAGRMLERLGFDVLSAEDGVEALRIVREQGGRLRAVLLDLSMPRMGGQEALHRLRELLPELPVVLMSGYTESDVASKLLGDSSGAIAFLQKPFLPEDLSRALRRAVEPARA